MLSDHCDGEVRRTGLVFCAVVLWSAMLNSPLCNRNLIARTRRADKQAMLTSNSVQIYPVPNLRLRPARLIPVAL
jgi:hypothetical protein